MHPQPVIRSRRRNGATRSLFAIIGAVPHTPNRSRSNCSQGFSRGHSKLDGVRCSARRELNHPKDQLSPYGRAKTVKLGGH